MSAPEPTDAPEQEEVRRIASELDGVTRHILRELDATSETHTSHLTDKTGERRHAIHDRLDDLEAVDIVESVLRQPDTGGQRQRHATLTDRGRRFVDAGLVDAIQDTNVTVAALTERVAKLEGSVSARLDEIVRDAETVAENTAAAEVGDVWAELDRLGDSVGESLDRVESVVDAHDDRLETVEGQTDDLTNQTAKLKQRVGDLASKTDRLAGEVEGVAPTADTAAEQVADLQGRVAELEKKLSSFHDAAENLTARLSDEDRRFAARADRLDEHEQELQALRERVKELEEAESGGLF